MTPKDREEYVRSRWEHVIVCDGSYWHYAKGTILLNWANHCFHEFADWSAAYAFTLEREEQIRQVEEEIEWLGQLEENIPPRSPKWAAQNRIYERLKAALAELRKGMRQ